MERWFGIPYQTGKYFKINEKWVISKILNYFSSSTVFGVIRFSYFEFNHNVAEIAEFGKGGFGKRHYNTETVNSNTDWTSACILVIELKQPIFCFEQMDIEHNSTYHYWQQKLLQQQKD